MRTTKQKKTLSPEEMEESALFLKAMGVVRIEKDQTATEDFFTALAAHGEFKKIVKRPKTSKQATHTAQKLPDSKNRPKAPAAKTLHDANLFAAALAEEKREEYAFSSAMQDVVPLQGKGRDIPPLPTLAKTPAPSSPLLDFMAGKLEFALAFTDEYLEGYVMGLDELTMNKLRAGQYSTEAHLDLHGLNAMQAYQAMLSFFRNAYHRNLRAVLLVHGRGLNSPNGWGILREKVQDWLTQDPFKRVVLAFCTAQPCDGGPGSMYVLLRKFKKNRGKISWEGMPLDSNL